MAEIKQGFAAMPQLGDFEGRSADACRGCREQRINHRTNAKDDIQCVLSLSVHQPELRQKHQRLRVGAHHAHISRCPCNQPGALRDCALDQGQRR